MSFKERNKLSQFPEFHKNENSLTNTKNIDLLELRDDLNLILNRKDDKNYQGVEFLNEKEDKATHKNSRRNNKIVTYQKNDVKLQKKDFDSNLKKLKISEKEREEVSDESEEDSYNDLFDNPKQVFLSEQRGGLYRV